MKKKHFIDEMYDIVQKIENKKISKKEALKRFTILFQSHSFLNFKKHTLAHFRQYVYLFLTEHGFTIAEIAEALNMSERIIYKYRRIFN